LGDDFVILDYDKNNNIVIWDGESKWHDLFGNDVTSTRLAHFEQRGEIDGIAIDSIGIKSFPVVFAKPYVNLLDEVIPVLKDPSATDAVFGGVWYSGDSVTGFTLNVHVTTASATVGATIKARWKSLGQ
jgi:hypothetical protein